MGIEEWETCPRCKGTGEIRFSNHGSGQQFVYVTKCSSCHEGIRRKPQSK